MIIEITNLDIHTAERVGDALELANYSIETVQQADQLYSIGFIIKQGGPYRRKAKVRYSCDIIEGSFINGVVHGVKVTRQHYKGMGMMNAFRYVEEGR